MASEELPAANRGPALLFGVIAPPAERPGIGPIWARLPRLVGVSLERR